MHLSSFLTDISRKSLVRSALSNLYNANFFAVFLEIAARRKAETKSNDINTNALRAAWHDGYVDAVWDLYYFFDNYDPETKTALKPQAAFGAKESLINAGDLTEEEYNGIVSK